MPEPLCAIWEPGSVSAVDTWIAAGKSCPRSFMKHHPITLLDLANPRALDNINTAAEYLAARTLLDERATPPAPRALHVQYFASLRDQAGRSAETVASSARTPRELYIELRARHNLALDIEQLRVAVNDDFADWNRPLASGDAVVFLPPVAGG
jgi:molybdopterin converting factor subunit 1